MLPDPRDWRLMKLRVLINLAIAAAPCCAGLRLPPHSVGDGGPFTAPAGRGHVWPVAVKRDILRWPIEDLPNH